MAISKIVTLTVPELCFCRSSLFLLLLLGLGVVAVIRCWYVFGGVLSLCAPESRCGDGISQKISHMYICGFTMPFFFYFTLPAFSLLFSLILSHFSQYISHRSLASTLFAHPLGSAENGASGVSWARDGCLPICTFHLGQKVQMGLRMCVPVLVRTRDVSE